MTIEIKKKVKMLIITLPDGTQKEFPGPVTGADIAASIGPGLAKSALAVKVGGELKDLSHIIENDAAIEIVTPTHEDALEILRHDAAHVFAQAIKELYPSTQITIGPTIENGFYYDIMPEKLLTPEDFPKIEKKMAEIVDRNDSIVREEWPREKAIEFFKGQGEHFKAEIISDLPEGEIISVYRQGDFLDLCRGPHLPSTGKLGKAFKLMKVAGAYWRGDSNNPMLQRVYGTAWTNKKDLEKYLVLLEEAEKRDHRKLGRDMNLFHIQEEATGSVFWHANGWTLYRTIENYLRNRLQDEDYFEVRTPQLVDRVLWEKSGHWDKFRENMFITESEDKSLALKPMNCPCHVQIFKQGIKSYRDLPLKMSEFGSCHRNEPSGALSGIMRVRAFTQDDAHIFCTEDQIESQTKEFCDLLLSVYKDFGFEDVKVKFSDRPEKRAGSDAIWDKAEAALESATRAAGIDFSPNVGEGAFYGPKLEFVLKDALGREWQCGTLQVDYVLPERLDASYVGEDGNKHRPVMLHRAIFGSFERFIGILIEHFGGKFPLWLAPQQVVIAPITSEVNYYAEKLESKLKSLGMRVETDLRNEKINYKIREHSLAKVPLIMVVGKREAEEGNVVIRRLGTQDQQTLSLEDALNKIQEEAKIPGKLD